MCTTRIKAGAGGIVIALNSSRFSAARLRGRSRRAQQPAMPVIGYLNGALDDHRFSKWKAGSTRNVHKFAPMGHTQNDFALVKAA